MRDPARVKTTVLSPTRYIRLVRLVPLVAILLSASWLRAQTPPQVPDAQPPQIAPAAQPAQPDEVDRKSEGAGAACRLWQFFFLHRGSARKLLRKSRMHNRPK